MDDYQSDEVIRPWALLDPHRPCPIIPTIKLRWQQLLDAPTTTEQHCLSFLKDHAGILLTPRDYATLFAISELRFGADYRADFCLVGDGFSRGTQYTLIEMESPNARLFRKGRYMTNQLTTALGQIDEWRRWIIANRASAQQLFPSRIWGWDGLPHFNFRIVIGRREETEQVQDKLNDIRRMHNVDITSFDRLTTPLFFEHYHTYYMPKSSEEKEMSNGQPRLLNQVANPFTKTLTDAQWRTALKSGGEFGYHIGPTFLSKLAPLIEVNKELVREFDAYIATVDERTLWACRMQY